MTTTTARTTSDSATATVSNLDRAGENRGRAGEALPRAPWLSVAAVDMAPALARLRRQDAVSLDVLTEDGRLSLLRAAERLPYRAATPVIGEGDRKVYQDFSLSVAFEPDDLFHRFAKAFGRLVAQAAHSSSPVPLGAAFCFNDLILQRYPVGAGGITPHRDHIKYRELVALISLSGSGRFILSADRAGADPREVPIPQGSALLMVAPGFAGRRDRPFHALSDITQERYSLGLRYVKEV